MACTPGSQLGHYQIVSALGKGGMGEVWRARDTTLGREVAIKTLPDEFAQDVDRLVRFEREARLLASLNHPNIAGIHGLEEHGGTRFLVLELVEGDTLADRIQQGPIPVEEALKLALQIAEALEAAHERGVIHRDLKPGNIKVTDEGQVKVLDFGLAKAFAGETGDVGVSNSPTLSMAATQAGVILGTAAYMSPEQAKGRPTDTRADVWAFGCVMFEMLTGRQVFAAEDVSTILARVLDRDPDFTALPKDLHPRLRDVLRRCLQKNAKQRYHAIADVRFDIESVLADPSGVLVHPVAAVARGVPQSKLPWIAAVVTGAIVAGLGIAFFMRATPVEPIHLNMIHSVAERLGNGFDNDVVVSPDGERIVYLADSESGDASAGKLYMRRLNAFEPVLLADSARAPFFSPDGQWVGFFAGTTFQLMKVAVTGGPAFPIGGPDTGARGATWGPDDTILFATNDPSTGLSRIAADGGMAEVLTTPDVEAGETDHVLPEFLPGGRTALFTITNRQGIGNSQIALLNLDTGTYRVLIQGGSHGRYVGSGHIVYGVAGTLRAMAFDLDSLEVRGTPVPVVDGVITKPTGAASFSVSSDGTLVYLAGDATGAFQRNLVWVDRNGREEPISAPPRNYQYPRLSPDGTRLALDSRDEENDIWIWDFARQNLARLTFDPGFNRGPVWTPDGSRVVFSAARDGAENIYWQSGDGSGTPELLVESPVMNAQIFPHAFSPDGTQLLFTNTNPPRDIFLSSVDGSQVEPLMATSFSEFNPSVSPDGRWLAFESDESGRFVVYVRPFPEVQTGRWQISTAGGTRPLWSRDGRELFYLETQGRLMSAAVENGPTFVHRTPRMVFEGGYAAPNQGRTYDVSADSQRFVMIKNATGDAGGDAAPPHINIVLNWFEELKARVPVP
jgi:serine/threonine-protein kinase